MILVNEPLLYGNEKKYLQECIDTGWISSEGPFVKKFEEKFSKIVNRSFGISVCNGSVALDLAVIAAGIMPGDEVILPTFTIISPAAAIVRAGAIPVLIDCDAHTWNMQVDAIEKKITIKTKAILIVHIYGLPVDIDPILLLAKKYNLLVIEDAAEMHGQTYNGKPCGSFGDISTFSFYPNKHVTTGEGGMIVTNNKKIADKCYSLRNLAFVPERRFIHYELGWNYRFTNIQAALGLAQLEQLNNFIVKKRQIGSLYNELFLAHKDVLEMLQLPLDKTDYATNIYWVYGMILKNKNGKNAQQIMHALQEVGVGSRPFFYPMHMQPVFNNMGWYKKEQYPVAEHMADYGFYIPSGLAITENQQIEVAEKVIKILKK